MPCGEHLWVFPARARATGTIVVRGVASSAEKHPSVLLRGIPSTHATTLPPPPRVFTRSYHVDVAPVAARLLEEVLAEGAVHPLLRSIVTETLQI